MKILQLSTLGLAVALSGALVGCSNTTPENSNSTSDAGASTEGAAPTSNVKLNGAGATFPYPIYSKWFEAYNSKTGVQINYQAVGSGAGIKQLTNQTVDFGASDSPLKEDEEKAMPGPVLQLPTVAGAVVLAYNLPNGPENLKMTGQNVADIYLGKIKKWNDPAIAASNPGTQLPDININPVHRSDGSGTSAIFTDYLSQVSPEWKTKVGKGKSVNWPMGIGGKGNDGVASSVKQSPGGFGYVELAYALQNKLSYVTLKNKAGQFVTPSVEATTAAIEGALPAVKKDITASITNADGAKSYPIAALTYVLVYKTNKDAAKTKGLTEFLTWAMEDGQQQAAELHYAPLPTELIDLNKKAIAQIK